MKGSLVMSPLLIRRHIYLCTVLFIFWFVCRMDCCTKMANDHVPFCLNKWYYGSCRAWSFDILADHPSNKRNKKMPLLRLFYDKSCWRVSTWIRPRTLLLYSAQTPRPWKNKLMDTNHGVKILATKQLPQVKANVAKRSHFAMATL